MGIMIISAFLAYLLWKAIHKKAPDFLTAGLVTFIVLLGFMVGLTFPSSYGNAEILYTQELRPVNGTEFYLEVSFLLHEAYSLHYRFLVFVFEFLLMSFSYYTPFFIHS